MLNPISICVWSNGNGNESTGSTTLGVIYLRISSRLTRSKTSQCLTLMRNWQIIIFPLLELWSERTEYLGVMEAGRSLFPGLGLQIRLAVTSQCPGGRPFTQSVSQSDISSGWLVVSSRWWEVKQILFTLHNNQILIYMLYLTISLFD